MRRNVLWWGLGFVVIVMLACSTTPSPTPNPEEAIATQVAATLAALGGPTQNPQDALATAVAATVTAVSGTTGGQPTAPPVTAQLTPTPAVLTCPWPTGVWVGDKDNYTADLYAFPNADLAGVSSLPQVGIVDAAYMRPLGSGNQRMFVTSDYQGQIVLYTPATGQTQTYFTLPSGSSGNPSALIAFLSHPPFQTFAFSYMVYNTNYQQLSYLALGEPGQQVERVLSVDATEGYGLLPLIFEEEAHGHLVALWATTQIFGIGDVAVAPSKGLWRIDLSSKQATQILPPESNGAENYVLGVSPTGQWFATWRPDDPTHVRVATPAHPDQPLLFNIVTAQTGASAIGYATFSPDGQALAWMEYTGGFDTGYTGHLALIHLPDGQPLTVSNPLPADLHGFPVAWVNSHTLLLRGWQNDGPVVVIWDFQGQAAPTELLGEFLGLEYGP